MDVDPEATTARTPTQKILVLRLSSLGDVVLTSSFLQSLTRHFPKAEVTFVVREDLTEVASALPGVACVLAVPRHASPLVLFSMAARLARGSFAHVFDLHESLRSRILAVGLHRRLREGFSKQAGPRWALVHMHRDFYALAGGARSLRQRMLEPLRRMGLDPKPYDTRLVLPEPIRAGVETRLEESGVGSDTSLVGVAPGARWSSKRWPAERYAALVGRLAQTPGRQFVVVGGPTEQSLARTVSQASGVRCIDWSGQLGILETAAVLERCSLLLTNDSGLLHVAEAVGCPVLAFFGPTAPQFGYVPYRSASRMLRSPPPCSPCSKNGSRACHRPTHECMENIPVDEAYETARSILREGVTI